MRNFIVNELRIMALNCVCSCGYSANQNARNAVVFYCRELKMVCIAPTIAVAQLKTMLRIVIIMTLLDNVLNPVKNHSEKGVCESNATMIGLHLH